jgi:Rad3-related DNA helicase
MQDSEILGRINMLVDEEHTLRERLQQGDLTADEEHQRLRDLEQELDQCWDLLRQRRARREAGENPDDARSRPTGEVEGYLQ